MNLHSDSPSPLAPPSYSPPYKLDADGPSYSPGSHLGKEFIMDIRNKEKRNYMKNKDRTLEPKTYLVH